MDKFDENNNPIFSKSEDMILNFLATTGFGALAFLIFMVCSYIVFYPLYLAVKTFAIEYTAIFVFIVCLLIPLILRLIFKVLTKLSRH